MRRIFAIMPVVVGASLFAFLLAEAPCGSPLGDDVLASVTGRDLSTGGIPADCANNTITGTQVVSTNCPQSTDPQGGKNIDLLIDPIECVSCFDGSFKALTPPEYGLGGYKKPRHV